MDLCVSRLFAGCRGILASSAFEEAADPVWCIADDRRQIRAATHGHCSAGTEMRPRAQGACAAQVKCWDVLARGSIRASEAAQRAIVRTHAKFFFLLTSGSTGNQRRSFNTSGCLLLNMRQR